MKKRMTLLLICICICGLLFGCSSEGPTNAPSPTIEDAAATFNHEGILLPQGIDIADIASKVGADDALVFYVDSTQAIVYSFDSAEALKDFQDSDESAKDWLVNGCLLLDASSSTIQDIFKTIELGNAEKWPIGITDAVLEQLYMVEGVYEVTIDGAHIARNALDDKDFTAGAGNIFVEMKFNIKNTGEEIVDAKDFIRASFTYNGFKYQGSVRAYDSSDKAWKDSLSIEPSGTYDIRIIALIPESAETDDNPINSDITILTRQFSFEIK